jgi:hypothetical protein
MLPYFIERGWRNNCSTISNVSRHWFNVVKDGKNSPDHHGGPSVCAAHGRRCTHWGLPPQLFWVWWVLPLCPCTTLCLLTIWNTTGTIYTSYTDIKGHNFENEVFCMIITRNVLNMYRTVTFYTTDPFSLRFIFTDKQHEWMHKGQALTGTCTATSNTYCAFPSISTLEQSYTLNGV